jgi:tRNA-specific 2-thiouridylase
MEQDLEVIGVTFKMWSEQSPEAAEQVADFLGIRLEVVDLSRIFEEKILRYAWQEYSQGRTPNPCVRCNPTVKFDQLLAQADRLDAKLVATGHYARIETDDADQAYLARGLDKNKDQSYFLHRLTSAQLERIVFPLGSLTKDQVRAKARKFKLPNAERAESQDACFSSPDINFAEVLRQKFSQEPIPGDFVDPKGKVLGRHRGIYNYTIGQRRGLKIALGQRAFVCKIDPAKNQVVLDTDSESILHRRLRVSRVNWLAGQAGRLPLTVESQIRYRHKAAPAMVEESEDGQVLVSFEKPQRAITPGQAAVFYDGDRLLGGGWIDKVL